MLGRLRQIAKHACIEFLFRSGATMWARKRLELRGESIVLTFHRVLDDEAIKRSSSPAGMILHQQTFADLVTALARDVEFVSLRDLPRPSRRLLVAVTFDDGWSDSLRASLDVLNTRAIPSCIFICSHMVGRSSPFWPERALSGLRSARSAPCLPQGLFELLAAKGLDLHHISEDAFLQFLKSNPGARPEILEALADAFPPPRDTPDTTMSWAELRDLMAHGIELGSHTARHEILTDLAPSEQITELLDCSALMEQQLNLSPAFFSYPNGSWNEEAKRSVVSCSYRHSFINQPGVWSEDTDPHLVPRINLSQNRLVGLDGRFSIASVHYCLFWLPYLHRRRSRRSSARLRVPFGPIATST